MVTSPAPLNTIEVKQHYPSSGPSNAQSAIKRHSSNHFAQHFTWLQVTPPCTSTHQPAKKVPSYHMHHHWMNSSEAQSAITSHSSDHFAYRITIMVAFHVQALMQSSSSSLLFNFKNFLLFSILSYPLAILFLTIHKKCLVYLVGLSTQFIV